MSANGSGESPQLEQIRHTIIDEARAAVGRLRNEGRIGNATAERLATELDIESVKSTAQDI
jgi:hypothetical protein